MLYTRVMEGLPNYVKEIRPWGGFERFTLNESSTVKLITLTSGDEFSLQKHTGRDEFWRIVSGSGSIHINNLVTDVKLGDSFYCPRGTVHRAKGGPGGLVFLEISLGTFDEQDITRLEDNYGRV